VSVVGSLSIRILLIVDKSFLSIAAPTRHGKIRGAWLVLQKLETG
jgi:hypothetical protein